MYYELYIDIFFLVNFIMDISVLSISKKILKCPATYRSILFAAMIGSAMTCMVVILPVAYGFTKFLIVHGPISYLMIKLGLRISSKQDFIKAYMIVYVNAFLFGGILSSFQQYLRESVLFFGFAMLSYYVVLKIWEYMSHIGRYKNIQCEVLLVNGGEQIKAKAIIDTGNRLRDNMTGKPVHIISANVAMQLWQHLPDEGVRYIPYHSIGKKEGVLPLIVLEKMCLYLEEET